ncbi:CidA/LrgA family protein [Roseomonas sp. BN140053]|uniref:CidA/LrgA family protein n=1 Tax=Roseomonas sp. BN140053 TaxID=3391898 RepID=UPI0039E92B02
MIAALAGLLVCQLAGEVLARALGLPVPGPVIGAVILFALLVLRDRAAPPMLVAVAGGLLGNLGLLFVPAGVGVVVYLPTLARDWAPLSLAILAGTLAAIAVTGRLAQALLRPAPGMLMPVPGAAPAEASPGEVSSGPSPAPLRGPFPGPRSGAASEHPPGPPLGPSSGPPAEPSPKDGAP